MSCGDTLFKIQVVFLANICPTFDKNSDTSCKKHNMAIDFCASQKCQKLERKVSLIGLMMHHTEIMLEVNEMRTCSKFMVVIIALEGGRM